MFPTSSANYTYTRVYDIPRIFQKDNIIVYEVEEPKTLSLLYKLSAFWGGTYTQTSHTRLIPTTSGKYIRMLTEPPESNNPRIQQICITLVDSHSSPKSRVLWEWQPNICDRSRVRQIFPPENHPPVINEGWMTQSAPGTHECQSVRSVWNPGKHHPHREVPEICASK